MVMTIGLELYTFDKDLSAIHLFVPFVLHKAGKVQNWIPEFMSQPNRSNGAISGR